MHVSPWRVFAFAAISAPLLACAPKDDAARPDSASGTVAMADSSGMTPPVDAAAADASTASFIVAVNEAEIEAGRLAATKARDGDVKDFARDMVDGHQKELTDLQQLSAKNGWTASSSSGTMVASVTQLQQSQEQLMTSLRNATGAAFDRAYIDGQVTAHQQALEVLRQQAMTLQNTELKEKVTSIQKDVTDHLARAQEISRKLGPA